MKASQLISTAAVISFAAGISMAGPGERPPQNPVLSREVQARREASRAAAKKRRGTSPNLSPAVTAAGGTHLRVTTVPRGFTPPAPAR